MARRSGFQKPKSAKKTLLRILSYLMRRKWLLLLVAVFVFISAAAAVTGTYMLKPIINEYIVPLIGTSPQAADFVPLLRMLSVMAVVYLLGALSSYLYNRIMVTVANNTLNAVRTDLFNHMEDLPIKYFDTHTHGRLLLMARSL